jgi:hypothetical protein
MVGSSWLSDGLINAVSTHSVTKVMGGVPDDRLAYFLHGIKTGDE